MGTKQTRSNYVGGIDTTHANNTSGDISAQDGRDAFQDLSASAMFKMDDAAPRYVATGGSSNAYTVTVDHPDSYQEGFSFVIKPNHANTGAATIDVTPSGGSALGAKDLRDLENNALTSGALKTTNYYHIIYNGTQFQIIHSLGTGADISGTPTLGEIAQFTNSTTIEGSGILMATEDIGDWNMDSTSNVNVTFTGVDHTKIRSVDCIIRDDNSSSAVRKLEITNSSGNNGGYINTISNSSGDTVVNLQRVTSGVFDNASFDSTSYNRGWVTIWYTT